QAAVSSGSSADNAVTLNTVANLLVRPSAGISTAGTITGNSGLTGAPVTIDVEGSLAARLATFNGGNQASVQGDAFIIAPSPSTPIQVNGAAPVVLPGDSLSLSLQSLAGTQVQLAFDAFGPGA